MGLGFRVVVFWKWVGVVVAVAAVAAVVLVVLVVITFGVAALAVDDIIMFIRGTSDGIPGEMPHPSPVA